MRGGLVGGREKDEHTKKMTTWYRLLSGPANSLNFGGGEYPLPFSNSLNGRVQLTAGAEYCFGSGLCSSLFAGYLFEKTISNNSLTKKYSREDNW